MTNKLISPRDVPPIALIGRRCRFIESFGDTTQIIEGVLLEADEVMFNRSEPTAWSLRFELMPAWPLLKDGCILETVD